MPKYYDPGSSVVTIHINGIQIQNVLIELGAWINLITREFLLRLSIIGLWDTPTILQLFDNSIFRLEGMVEDVVVTLDSLDYPLDFIVLSPKATLGGYPLILRWPWLATADACISCHSGKMTISYGMKTKKLTLYSLAKPK